jgi:hypothetical protein
VKNKQPPRMITLAERFPPSPPCQCDICQSYCQRPGWWTVDEAQRAIKAGFGARMMLEVSPEQTFCVLSPAFCGCEGNFALQGFADKGCTFLANGLCELHGTGLQPLECRYCHHARKGSGIRCHEALEGDWFTKKGQALVESWAQSMDLWNRYGADGNTTEGNHGK